MQTDYCQVRINTVPAIVDEVGQATVASDTPRADKR